MNSSIFLNLKRSPLLLAALLAMACGHLASAAEPTRVTTTPSQTSRQVAEPFWLDWTVKAPSGARVTFPSTGDKLGDFDILDSRDLFDIPNDESGDERTWTRRLQLESIVTGELEIPSIEIQVADAQSSQVIRSEPITVQIVSVLEERGDPTQFRDIQSVVDVDVPNRPSHAWIGWSLAGFSALALAVAAVTVATRRKRWQTPAQWALAQLDELEAAMKEQDGAASATQLASIMQNFLQLQYSLPEPGRTSEEMLHVLNAKQHVDEATWKELRCLFALADEAKFAGLSVSPTQGQEMIEHARSLVRRISDVMNSEKLSPALTTTEAR